MMILQPFLVFLITAASSDAAFLPQHHLQHRPLVRAPRVSSTRSPSTDTSSSNTNEKSSSKISIYSASVSNSDCDNENTTPGLNILLKSLENLQSGSDIRGYFMDHKHVACSFADVAHAVEKARDEFQSEAALTPFAAYCFGHAFAKMILDGKSGTKDAKICVGRDPRSHGARLCDSFARGAESIEGVKVQYTGIATTPSLNEFCRSGLCDGGVMVTASHLPKDRNGLKFFSRAIGGGFTKQHLAKLVEYAKVHARELDREIGLLPPSSGDGVFCTEWVDYMPKYAASLCDALVKQVGSTDTKPLNGLKIVLNPGHGSGGFFHSVLEDLGADVSGSIHLDHDETFPAGVPNPENKDMFLATKEACEACQADLGVMLDTDADRSGFVVPRSVKDDGTRADYEPLKSNRLIALLGVVFSESSPGCTIVTDSVTSEGLATFLTDKLGLQHNRFIKGYANVIGKARELTKSGKANAEVAIETSGHCAMKENDYLDDGTYTAVKVIGELAQNSKKSLLDLISDMEECPQVDELRFTIKDGSLETTTAVFDKASSLMEDIFGDKLDTENLEGVRFRTGNGGFFMLRKSLHDPLVSLQLEGTSLDELRTGIVQPLLERFQADPFIEKQIDLGILEKY